jgi:hypothetical protein
VVGQRETGDKPYIQGWANFAPFDFEKGKWMTVIE